MASSFSYLMGSERFQRVVNISVRHEFILGRACEVSLIWQGNRGAHRECTHFILKSSAASFALSMSRIVLALSLEATRICGRKINQASQKMSSGAHVSYSFTVHNSTVWDGYTYIYIVYRAFEMDLDT